MILINLLPHREEARKRRREAANMKMVFAVLVGLFICVTIYMWFQGQISAQEDRNSYLKAEVAKLEEETKDVASLETEIESLRARQNAVEDLQSDRNLPVYLLSELVKLMPDGAYLTNLKQTGQQVTILGVAQSNERVSELLRALGGKTEWFGNPQLIEIVNASMALTPRDNRRVSNFNISMTLMRSSDLKKLAEVAAANSTNK